MALFMQNLKTDFQLSIIAKITNLRQNHHLTQIQMAEILDLSSAGQIGNIESPKYSHKYTLEQIYKISKYLGYPIEKIFLSESELENSISHVVDILFIKLIDYEK